MAGFQFDVGDQVILDKRGGEILPNDILTVSGRACVEGEDYICAQYPFGACITVDSSELSLWRKAAPRETSPAQACYEALRTILANFECNTFIQTKAFDIFNPAIDALRRYEEGAEDNLRGATWDQELYNAICVLMVDAQYRGATTLLDPMTWEMVVKARDRYRAVHGIEASEPVTLTKVVRDDTWYRDRAVEALKAGELLNFWVPETEEVEHANGGHGERPGVWVNARVFVGEDGQL